MGCGADFITRSTKIRKFIILFWFFFYTYKVGLNILSRRISQSLRERMKCDITEDTNVKLQVY